MRVFEILALALSSHQALPQLEWIFRFFPYILHEIWRRKYQVPFMYFPANQIILYSYLYLLTLSLSHTFLCHTISHVYLLISSSSNPIFAYFYIVLSHYPIFPTEILHLYSSLIFLHHNFLDLSCPFNWHKQTLLPCKVIYHTLLKWWNVQDSCESFV